MFSANASQAFVPRYNIAPTQDIAAIRQTEEGDIECRALRWGLIPFWAKDKSIGNRMINARAETIAEKPSFRAAYKKRRCLIPADGFYEWRKDAGEKTPWYITTSSDEPFAFAGLWEDWTDKQTGESIQSATIVTTAANAFMADLHHRMPVILEPETARAWLQGEPDFVQEFNDALCPSLQAWPVQRTVNKASNEGAELIIPDGDLKSD